MFLSFLLRQTAINTDISLVLPCIDFEQLIVESL